MLMHVYVTSNKMIINYFPPTEVYELNWSCSTRLTLCSSWYLKCAKANLEQIRKFELWCFLSSKIILTHCLVWAYNILSDTSIYNNITTYQQVLLFNEPTSAVWINQHLAETVHGDVSNQSLSVLREPIANILCFWLRESCRSCIHLAAWVPTGSII